MLKISNSSEDPQETNFQTQALVHAHKVDPSLPISTLVPSIEGKVELKVERGGEVNIVRLLSYLPGIPVRVAIEKRPTKELRQDLGVSLAKLGKKLELIVESAICLFICFFVEIFSFQEERR